jgi:hypothetical protein
MKIVSVTVLLVCLAAGAEAQERQAGGKIGPTFGTLTFNTPQSGDYGMRTGATGGAFLVLPLSPRLALQLEALYAQKGGELTVPELPDTAAILLGYVEFPVLMRVEAPRIGRAGFHVFGGPGIGFRATAKRQFTAAGQFGSSGVQVDMSDEIRFVEATATVGAGFEPHRRIVIDGRYTWGLSAINRDASDDFRVRTRTLTFMIGVRFAR